jgi:predicted acylesterase/phospholipase RssA
VRYLVRSIALIAALAVAGAGTFRFFRGPIQNYGPIGSCLTHNIDLNNPAPYAQTRFSGTVVGVAASGGGSRAAYLQAAILREIRRGGEALRIGSPPHAGASLLNQIDLISSVSGGSLASSYYSLNSRRLLDADAAAPEWTTFLDKMAIDYRTRQWYGPVAWNPITWMKSAFTDFNRGIVARDDYSAELFGAASLADFPDRPAILVNAFDVANHVRFILSKSHVDTSFFQPRNWTRKLGEPQTLLAANDLTYARIDPSSISVADAARASSAFPIAYPNVPLKHCGSGIAFQGSQIFLADGALADNSGLVTLMTQLRAGLDTRAGASSIVGLYIDASVDRIDRNGTKFQQTGVEGQYAWRNTVFGHATESIFGAIALLQDLGWKQIEAMDVVTDQINMNWPQDLLRRSGTCDPPNRASWKNLFESGALNLRPLVIRLGLRDVINPDFAMMYGAYLQDRPELDRLLAANQATDGIAQLPKDFSRRLQSIPTDFTLAARDRQLLDLAAFLLVHGKLAGDIAQWNEIYRSIATSPATPLKCPF